MGVPVTHDPDTIVVPYCRIKYLGLTGMALLLVIVQDSLLPVELFGKMMCSMLIERGQRFSKCNFRGIDTGNIWYNSASD